MRSISILLKLREKINYTIHQEKIYWYKVFLLTDIKIYSVQKIYHNQAEAYLDFCQVLFSHLRDCIMLDL